MSEEWHSGDAPSIAYHEPICRFAYLYCHVAANANLCELAIRTSSDVMSLINSRLDADEELRVCAFGGGPGTELLALSKHICKTRQTPNGGRACFTLLDSVLEWSESWNVLEKGINDYLKNKYGKIPQRPFSTNKSFYPLDMTKLSAFANLQYVFEHDLYFMNYVVSELVANTASLAAVVRSMANAAPSGAKLLLIDRDQQEVREAAISLFSDCAFVPGAIATTATKMDDDEQSSELKLYRDQIGRWPRTKWRNDNTGKGAFYLVASKT